MMKRLILIWDCVRRLVPSDACISQSVVKFNKLKPLAIRYLEVLGAFAEATVELETECAPSLPLVPRIILKLEQAVRETDSDPGDVKQVRYIVTVRVASHVSPVSSCVLLAFAATQVKSTLRQELARRHLDLMSLDGMTWAAHLLDPNEVVRGDAVRQLSEDNQQLVLKTGLSVIEDLTKRFGSSSDRDAPADSHGVKTLMSMLKRTSSTSGIIQDNYGRFVDEVNRDPPHRRSTMEWWTSKKDMFPLLHAAVRVLFAIPATTAPVERLFSEAGFVVGDRRGSLSSGMAEKCILTYHNLRFLPRDRVWDVYRRLRAKGKDIAEARMAMESRKQRREA